MHSWTTDRRRLLDEPPPTSPYLKKAYAFALEWVNGKTSFNISTSGSTGTPKRIQISREQMIASASMTGRALRLPTDTRSLVCLNVEYIAGMMMLVRGLELGWEMTIIEPVSNPLKELDSTVGFDFVALVPLQLYASLRDRATLHRIHQYGKVLLGGAPVELSLQKQIENLTIPVYQSYGMTETVSHIALRSLNGPEKSDAYTVLDAIDYGQDERGCLFIEGAVTGFQKIQTNDLVKLGPERTFWWLGRADSIINSGGVKIQLQEIDLKIETALLELQKEVEFFSWYESDEKLGQKLVVFMNCDEEYIEVPALIKELKALVKVFEIPKAVYFVDSFERTATNKIDKVATAQNFFKAQT